MELFGLATNLTKVETGSRLFLDTFKKNSCSNNRTGDFNYWRHNLKNYINGYSPQSCDKFCPHSDQCHHGTNILSTTKLKYHQMERLANYDERLASTEEAEEDFKRKLISAIDTDDTKWHIIKAQTAIGKTETYLRLVRNISQRVLIAVPTNKLKHEVRERAEAMGIEMIESPSLREIKDDLPNDVWDHIEYLYASGKSVIPYLKKVIHENHPECAALFKQHLIELDKFRKFEGHAITTHKRFLTMDVSKYDLVIIDEDILLGSIIQNKIDINMSDLRKLRKKTAGRSRILFQG